jgi:hypothetical protein
MISSGGLALPAERNTLGPTVSVTNTTSYTSYKMLFPTLKGPDLTLMQIAEASFFASSDASTPDLLNPGDFIRAIDSDPTTTTGLQTKYLNFGEENSGAIITPAAGPKVLTSFQITTANDAEARDPASYKLYGTNDTIVDQDNGLGNLENWTLISEGALTLPAARMTAGDVVTVTNTTSYKSYRIVFPTVKDATAANSMQIAGLQFFDSSVAVDVDLDNDGDVDGNDLLLIQRTDTTLIDDWKAAAFGAAVAAVGSVPEPGAGLMALCGLSLLAWRRRSAR